MAHIPANQTVSFTTFACAIHNATPVPAAFLKAQSVRIEAAFNMGETVKMVAEEMVLRHQMSAFRRHKTPRQLAVRVTAF